MSRLPIASADECCVAEEENTQTYAPARIFDAQQLDEPIPEGFNSVKITLNGKVNSALKWEKEVHTAARKIQKGLRILWELDLGLFDQLKYPLGNQSQFLSLTLALEHFCKTVWEEFSAHSIGVVLYRGAADFSLGFQWDAELEQNLRHWLSDRSGELSHLNTYASTDTTHTLVGSLPEGKRLLSLFCRDAGAQFFEHLADYLPQQMDQFLILEQTDLPQSALTAAQLCVQERFARFKLLGLEKDVGYIGRKLPAMPQEVKVGVCLPPLAVYAWEPELEHALTLLQARGVSYRALSESHLTIGWDGLDYLVAAARLVTPQGRRRLCGFCAAGGTVVALGESLGLPQEATLEQLFKECRDKKRSNMPCTNHV
jgi:hypothetical protein